METRRKQCVTWDDLIADKCKYMSCVLQLFRYMSENLSFNGWSNFV